MALFERVEGMSIAACLANRATRDPGRTFLLHQDRLITFGQVESRADAMAASLSSLGIEAGDRIALILPPCPEFVIAFFAASKLGVVVVPLNPHLTKPELHYMLRHGTRHRHSGTPGSTCRQRTNSRRPGMWPGNCLPT